MSPLRALAVPLVVSLSLFTAPASAQVVDLATVTCKEFIDSPKETIGLFLMWLDGYYHEEDDPAVIDFGKMKEIGGKLGAYCAQNPTISLMTAAEPIYSK